MNIIDTNTNRGKFGIIKFFSPLYSQSNEITKLLDFEKEKSSIYHDKYPTCIYKILKNLKKENINYFVAGIQYKKLDIQIGVTGKQKNKEELLQLRNDTSDLKLLTSSREMGEEIGIIPDNIKDLINMGYTKIKKINWNCFKINISKCKLVSKIDIEKYKNTMKKYNNLQDLFNQKVIIIIYGTIDEIDDFYHKDTNLILRYPDLIEHQSIIGVTWIPISYSINFMNKGKNWVYK